MNTSTIEGRWNEISGKAKQRWAKLTTEDLARINGKREELIGAVQQRYGKAKDEVVKDVDAFMSDLSRSLSIK